MSGNELGTVGLLVIFPVLAAVIGAALAALRPPGARLTSGVQHFAAGAVLAAVALDVLPGLNKQGHLAIATAGFAAGAAILLGVRALETHGSAAGDGPASGLPTGLLVAVTVELTHRGMGATRAALAPPLLSLALVAGAIVAVLVLGSALAALLAAILGFGVAALLFLATEELLVEAHETTDTPLLAGMFFVGFFALYILDASHYPPRVARPGRKERHT